MPVLILLDLYLLTGLLKDCRLGVHTTSNCFNEKNFEFFWGYKNHTLVDLISGLPIYEFTFPANITDSSVAVDILQSSHKFLPLDEYSFVADIVGLPFKYLEFIMLYTCSLA